MRPLTTLGDAEQRLRMVFPRSAFDPVLSNPLAAAAVRAFIYVDAVHTADDVEYWGRPSTVMWMSDQTATRTSDSERIAWRDAAARGRNAVVELVDHWGLSTTTPYADNTRETLRDETFKKWLDNGAIRERAGVPKTSSKGRWALEGHFADLFSPDLAGDDLLAAVTAWQDAHLNPSARLKVLWATQEQSASHAVTIALPNSPDSRTLEGGTASLILKAVVEEWSTTRLTKPFVVTISEPGDKIFTGDAGLLNYLGVTINTSALLPDALIADLGTEPVQFWLIEAVNTDGEINESRKAALLTWAAQQNIKPEQCSFLTAFASRNDGAARRRLKDLAAGTFAYFADEPGHELAWYAIH